MCVCVCATWVATSFLNTRCPLLHRDSLAESLSMECFQKMDLRNYYPGKGRKGTERGLTEGKRKVEMIRLSVVNKLSREMELRRMASSR